MKRESPGTTLSYSIGFALSVAMTLAAYVAVVNKALTGQALAAVIVGLAIAQLLVQLLFFLHIGKESRPRLKLLAFCFMIVVLAIVVIGSLWIMYSLDYHMVPDKDIDSAIMEDERIHK